MGVIINDFSLDGQFYNEDEFLESLYMHTIPMLDRLEELKTQILSSFNSYTLPVTKDKTLYDILSIKGSAEIRKFKRQLQELFFDEPYWDSNPKSINSIYKCEFTKEDNSYCLAEAVERDFPVISFEHERFKESTIKIEKDHLEYVVKNIYNQAILLEIFRENKQISQLKYLLLRHSLTQSFGLKYGKNYFEELVDSCSLSEEDIKVIVDDMEKLISQTKNGENPGRLSGPIDGKLKEFRTSLSNKREIRFFYFEVNRRIIFMNGFLKKTQQTPQEEIEKAKRIMKMYYE
ncbi:type II toxin-antitoxin system RelE/ParE family toxin [Clostridium butyricum]